MVYKTGGTVVTISQVIARIHSVSTAGVVVSFKVANLATQVRPLGSAPILFFPLLAESYLV